MQKNRWALGLAALALTSLTACGGEETEDTEDTEEVEVLSSEEAESALIPESAMGEGFVATEPTEDETNMELGCLSALDEMDDLGAETEAAVEYVPADDSGFPALENSVFSYADPGVISARMEEISTALEGCDSVDVTDDEGTRFTLDVSFDDEVTASAADEQVTLEASGTISAPGQEIPITLHMSSVRVDNHVTVVIYSELSDDQAAASSEFDSYVTTAAERLVAVASGETPE